MKTITENAKISFRQDFARLKSLKKCTNKQLADMLGCSEVTISRVYRDPLSVSSIWVLLIQEMLKREERKRYE